MAVELQEGELQEGVGHERADSPKALPRARMSRLVVAGVASTILGPLLALGLAFLFGATDEPGTLEEAAGKFLGIIGIAFLGAVLGFLLSVVAFIRVSRRADLRGTGWAVVGVLLPVVFFVLVALSD